MSMIVNIGVEINAAEYISMITNDYGPLLNLLGSRTILQDGAPCSCPW